MAIWNKIGIVIVLLALCAVGAFLWMGAPAQKRQPVAPPPQVDAATLPLVLQGRSYCSVTMPVHTSMPGVVEDICISIGQTVRKDDLLFKLKLSVTDASAVAARLNKGPGLRSMELNIRQMELKLAQLERNISEATQLTDLGMAPRNALTDLQDQRQILIGQIELSRVGLDDTRKAVADDLAILSKTLGQPLQIGSKPTYVLARAPMDGQVISIDAALRLGATVSNTLCTIGLMDPMVIRGQVHESELDRLQTGGNATIALDSGKGESFEATLSRISWTALDPGIAAPAYYLFELVMANPEFKIKDGFKVQVTLSPLKKKQ